MKVHRQESTGTESDRPIVPTNYCIEVDGDVDPNWSDWFGGLTMGIRIGKDGRTITILCGPVPDQAALRGILSRLWDINVTLLTISTVENDESDDTGG